MLFLFQSEQTAEEKRMDRRRELFQRLLKSSTNRLSGMKTDTGLDTKMKSTIAYKGAGQMPKEDDVRKLRLFVGKCLNPNLVLYTIRSSW